MTEIDEKTLLHGHGDDYNIIAIENEKDKILIFRKIDGKIEIETVENFKPFCWVKDFVEMPPHLKSRVKIEELKGDNVYNRKVTFESKQDYTFFKNNYVPELKRTMPERVKEDYSDFYSEYNLSTQYMMDKGITMFNGMEYNDLKIMAIDIETNGLGREQKFNPRSKKYEDMYTCNVEMVGIATNQGYEHVIMGKSEKETLEELFKIIKDQDPDVFIHYNGWFFDWAVIESACIRHGIKMVTGRRNKQIFKYTTTIRSGDNKQTTIQRYISHGRHDIDLYYMVKRYDAISRSLGGTHDLKSVIKELGLEREDRVYISGDQIAELLKTDPERVKEYCLDDVRETLALAEFLILVDFYQTKMLPYGFSQVTTLGNASKLESIMVRYYNNKDYSLPESESKVNFQGAISDCRHKGIFKNVFHFDVTSMYPSIMITYNVTPPRDELGIFVSLVKTLLYKRLEAKSKEKESMKCGDKVGEQSWYGYQNALKVLINCFHPDTTVYTNNGYRSIEDIKLGDIVMSINPETLEKEWQPVIGKEKKQKGAKMLKFTTNSGKSFKVTDGHNLAFLDGSRDVKHPSLLKETTLIKKEAKDFIVGDYLPCPIGKEDSSIAKDVKRFNLLYYFRDKKWKIHIKSKNEHLRSVKIKYNIDFMDKYDGNSRTCFTNINKLTDENIMLLNYINQIDDDVDIYIKPKKSTSTPISFDINDFMTFMGWYISEGSSYKSKRKDYGYTVRGVSHKIQIAQKTKENNEEIYQLLTRMGFSVYKNSDGCSFCSEPIYELLINIWNIGNSFNKKVPEDLLKLTNKHLSKLLDSYFKGDGNLLQTGKRRYSTVSYELKQNICFILDRLGIFYSILEEHYDNKTMYRIIERSKYTKIGNIVIDKIKSIEEIEMPEYVYDVTVAKNHTICVGDSGTVCTFQSLYGALGSQFFIFNFIEGAGFVTEKGREIITKMIELTEGCGFITTNIDTDGIYSSLSDIEKWNNIVGKKYGTFVPEFI